MTAPRPITAVMSTNSDVEVRCHRVTDALDLSRCGRPEDDEIHDPLIDEDVHPDWCKCQRVCGGDQ